MDFFVYFSCFSLNILLSRRSIWKKNGSCISLPQVANSLASAFFFAVEALGLQASELKFLLPLVALALAAVAKMMRF